MFCYRDMTFCTYWKECKDGSSCTRALTDKVQAEAEIWMKNPPICIYGEKPDCFVDKEK